MLAFAFLQYRHPKKRDGEKRINGPPPQPSLPAVRHATVALIARLPPKRCPHCPQTNRQLEQICQSSARACTHLWTPPKCRPTGSWGRKTSRLRLAEAKALRPILEVGGAPRFWNFPGMEGPTGSQPDRGTRNRQRPSGVRLAVPPQPTPPIQPAVTWRA
jgi:hypothetical protein